MVSEGFLVKHEIKSVGEWTGDIKALADEYRANLELTYDYYFPQRNDHPEQLEALAFMAEQDARLCEFLEVCDKFCNSEKQKAQYLFGLIPAYFRVIQENLDYKKSAQRFAQSDTKSYQGFVETSDFNIRMHSEMIKNYINAIFPELKNQPIIIQTGDPDAGQEEACEGFELTGYSDFEFIVGDDFTLNILLKLNPSDEDGDIISTQIIREIKILELTEE